MCQDDFGAFHAMMSDFGVVKMTMSWPWPAEPDFTRACMNTPEAKSGASMVIDCGGAFAGQIFLKNGEIGYMLARAYWGRGIATWAVREMLAYGFTDPDTKVITAGTWDDNPASMSVLRKCGFEKTGESTLFCRPRGYELNGPDYAITRANWADSLRFRIETKRLIIEPLSLDDAAELTDLMDDSEIARMMGSFVSPFHIEDARKWLRERLHSRNSGRFAKVSLHDGSLIGYLRLGVGRLAAHDEDISLGYAIGSANTGQGYASEAVPPFLAQSVADYAHEQVSAAVMSDNTASIRLLTKLGFKKIDERMYLVSGRLEKTPLFLYRLACTHRTAS